MQAFKPNCQVFNGTDGGSFNFNARSRFNDYCLFNSKRTLASLIFCFKMNIWFLLLEAQETEIKERKQYMGPYIFSLDPNFPARPNFPNNFLSLALINIVVN